MGAVGFRGDKQARGLLVKAVDDARPLDPADARKTPGAVVEEGIDDGSGAHPPCGMDQHRGRLVEDEEVSVLVEDLEGDGLWLHGGRL